MLCYIFGMFCYVFAVFSGRTKASVISFFWCFVLQLLLLYVFGLVFVQAVTGYRFDAANSETSAEDGWSENAEYLEVYWGNLGLAMLTLYQCSSGGMDWQDAYTVLAPMGGFYLFAFIFFIAFWMIAVFNVLTGIFIESARRVAQPDREYQMMHERRVRQKDLEEVLLVIDAMDLNASGTIDGGEFMSFMQHQTVRSYMLSLGIEVRDAELFFDVIADLSATGEVDVMSFAEGCLTMKGVAKSMDLQCLGFQVRMIHKNQLIFADYMTARLDALQTSMQVYQERLTGLFAII